jgi:hypothetical protein
MKRTVSGWVVMALVLLAQAGAWAGSEKGPRRYRDVRVRAKDERVYKVTFRQGERAEVAVMGQGTTDVDLFIYDESGRLVAADEADTDFCLCRWYPAKTQTYRVVVKNLDEKKDNLCLIAHN